MCNHKPGFGIISQTLKLKRFGVLVSIVSVKKLFIETAMSIGRKDAKRHELKSVLVLVTVPKLFFELSFVEW